MDNESLQEAQDITNVMPTDISWEEIEHMTNGFSKERIIGSGGYGVVYKGVQENGKKIAVKKLYHRPEFDQKQFQNEIQILTRLEHRNIVRLIGQTYKEQEKCVEYNGEHVLAKMVDRVICLEYLHNGSLQDHLSDEFSGLPWHKRYQIIKGICEGLNYLHEHKIFHLDLKPGNILLDDNMLPKIADFGLSKLFSGTLKSHTTANRFGTLGFMPPEFIEKSTISEKYDVFSLGVIIIFIMTGPDGYSRHGDMTSQDFIELVHGNWMTRLQKLESGDASYLDAHSNEVQNCITIALNCLEPDRHKRPSIGDIIYRLNEPETMTGESNKQLVVVHRLGEIETELMAALLTALSKIDTVLGDEVIKLVISKASKKATNLREIPENIRHIERELNMMRNVIQDLDTTNLSINVVKGWIGELRKVAFHVEDVIDKYSYHAFKLQEEGSLMWFIKGAHNDKVFSDIADEVVRIKGEIDKVKKLIVRHGSQTSLPELIQDEDVVGIALNQAKLIGWLHINEPNNTVITVSGMGGLGKTTLVMNVYEREKTKFPVRAWITVSQTNTIVGLLRELLRKIVKDAYKPSVSIESMDAYKLREEIKNALGTSKCLFVLDDVWNVDVYHQMDVIPRACRIIITTRSEHVASLASPERRLQLQPLGSSDALALFCRRAFNNRADRKCPPELQDVATSIVDRCKGLPLAIISMGSLMSSKKPTKHAWNQMYNQFRVELAKPDYVQAILKLSYNDLPGNLRNCFLYCSLFPEDCIISRESLVRQWVAEGFAVTNGNNTLEEVAELNLEELIARNLLQVKEYDEIGRVDTCKMHDIVRDLALSIAKDEKFGSANHQGAMIQMNEEVRHLSLCGWNDGDVPTVRFSRLRTLFSLDGVMSTHMLASFFSGSSYLTVLELQDSEITEVPVSIGNLFNLRYIGLRRTGVKSLPECIEKLSNLQTLDIKQTQIEKLPRGIVKVKKLRHLLADRVVDEKQKDFQYFAAVQPPKYLSNMVELQTLETVEATNDLANQLEKLRKLRSVWIGKVSTMHSTELFATLSKLPLLSSLLLNAIDEEQTLQLEALNPQSKQLRKLIVRGRWAAETLQCPIFQGHGKNLKYLTLSWSGLWEDPLLLIAPHVPNLTYLSLNRVSSTETMVISEGSFPQLKTLILKNMLNVNQLTVGKDALQNIEGLYIVALRKLDKVPQGFESLVSLRKLWLLYLHKDFKTLWELSRMPQKMPQVVDVRFE